MIPTESLPRAEILLPRKQNVSQTLIGAVCNGRVNDQNQTGLQTPPQTRPAVLAVDNLLTRLHQALLIALWLGLLSGGDDGNGDGEHLGHGTGNSTETEFDGGAGGLGHSLGGHVEAPHDAVPVEVSEVGGSDA